MIERKNTRTQDHTSARVQGSRNVSEHHYYQTVLYVIIASVFVFFIAFRAINISVERQLKIQMPEKEGSLSTDLPVKSPVVEQVKEDIPLSIRSSGPEEYNIKAQEQNILLQNQRRWNSSMRKTMRESNIIDRMSEGEAFKGIKKTPEQFRQQLDRIERRIREYEQKARKDPSDDYARQKLQGLYMLKATVKGLKKAVVEK